MPVFLSLFLFPTAARTTCQSNIGNLCVATASPPQWRYVALNKHATQSSDENENALAFLAVDGNSDSNYFHGSCSSTYTWRPNITHAWWMVDLQNIYIIGEITIQNRGDNEGERLKNLIIKNGRSNEDMVQRVSFPGPGTNGSYHVFKIDHFIGRYIRLETSDEQYAILTLCEVEVIGREVHRGDYYATFSGRKSNADLLEERQAKTVGQCLAYCSQLADCDAANYCTNSSAIFNCQLLNGTELWEDASEYKLFVSQ